MKDIKTYPIFMNLSGKTCLIVGAGPVAERKLAALRAAGAVVKVVAPEATGTIADLAAAGDILWLKRGFEAADLAEAALVVAATDDPRVNGLVKAESAKQGVIINVVDQPELCDFLVPAVVRRGHLQIAVSTDGVSPAFARRLRERLEADFGPEYGEYLKIVGDFRRVVRENISDQSTRERAYDRLFSSDVIDQIRRGEDVNVAGLVEQYAI